MSRVLVESRFAAGRRSAASVADPFGNVLGVGDDRHYLDTLGARAGGAR